MTPDPSNVLRLAQDILETKKKLDELEQQWNGMFNGSPIARLAVKATRAKRDGSIPKKVEDVLASDPSKTFTITEVSDALVMDQLQIGRALHRLYKTKRIESRGRGRYGAIQNQEQAA